jgi:hypothetical protein
LRTSLFKTKFSHKRIRNLNKNTDKMKKILFSVAFVVTSFTGIAQVGVGTTSPHISAALDVESTTLGFLPPRMDEVEMDAITIPEEGLMVY